MSPTIIRNWNIEQKLEVLTLLTDALSSMHKMGICHRNLNPNSIYTYITNDEIFVATGAKERKLSTPGFDSENVRYAVDFLNNQNIKDQNVVVVGADLTGCEIAYDLARKNNKVTVVETLPTILNVEGLSAANYNCQIDLMDYYKVDTMKSSQVLSYENGEVTVETTTTNVPNINGKALVMSLQGVHKTVKKIPADTVIVSVGYTSDQTLYEAIKGDNVHLLGDAEHPGNLMTAIWGAYTAALNI